MAGAKHRAGLRLDHILGLRRALQHRAGERCWGTASSSSWLTCSMQESNGLLQDPAQRSNNRSRDGSPAAGRMVGA